MTNKLSDDVKHEIDLLLNDDLVAFFAIVLSKPSDEILPTVIELDRSSLTTGDKLRLAEQLVYLGKKIREAALGRK